ncbi:hypothetical protein FACS1894186_4850 [Alphaproteobacteria bacterium]|nr:hypothetical protein FACS1894186_4850 [Alphaproteobacteria bacterium]
MSSSIGGIITTGSSPTRLLADAAEYVGFNYKRNEQIFSKIFDVKDSKKDHEIIVKETGFGGAKLKNQGEEIAVDSMKAVARTIIYNMTYALGFNISDEARDDDQTKNQLRDRSESLGQSLKTTIEEVHARYLASNAACIDGTPFFSTSHATIGAAARSNLLATQAPISAAALADVYEMIRTMRDDRGLLINMKPKAIVVPASLEQAAFVATGSYLRPDDSTNAVNFANKAYSGVQTIVNPYLDRYMPTTPMWFVKTDVKNCLLHYRRKALEMKEVREESKNSTRFNAYERYGFGFGDFVGAFAGQLAA